MRKQFLVRLSNWICFLKLRSLKNFADVGPCRFSGTKTILLLQLLPVFALPSEQKCKLHEGRTDMAFTLKWCNFTCGHGGGTFCESVELAEAMMGTAIASTRSKVVYMFYFIFPPQFNLKISNI